MIYDGDKNNTRTVYYSELYVYLPKRTKIR